MVAWIRLLSVLTGIVVGACGDKGAEDGSGTGGADQEVSFNLDMEDLQPLLARLAAEVDGFGDTEIAAIAGEVGRMKVDSTREWKFMVRHGTVRTLLRIQVFLDDVDAPDIALWTSRELASTIGAVVETYMEQQGK